jgi:hypothetical protein
MSGEYGTGKKKKTVKTDQPINYAFWIKIGIALFAIIATGLFLANFNSGSDAKEQEKAQGNKIANPVTGGIAGSGAIIANASESEIEVNTFPIVEVPIVDYKISDDFVINDGILKIPSELNVVYFTPRGGNLPNGALNEFHRGIIVLKKEDFVEGIKFTFHGTDIEIKGSNKILTLEGVNPIYRSARALKRFPATTNKDFASSLGEGKYVIIRLKQA